jgi:Flp pilus assembly pilin Flp
MTTLHSLSNLLHDEAGQDLIEYGLLGCLIAVAVVASFRTVATTVGGDINMIGNRLISVF